MHGTSAVGLPVPQQTSHQPLTFASLRSCVSVSTCANSPSTFAYVPASGRSDSSEAIALRSLAADSKSGRDLIASARPSGDSIVSVTSTAFLARGRPRVLRSIRYRRGGLCLLADLVRIRIATALRRVCVPRDRQRVAHHRSQSAAVHHAMPPAAPHTLRVVVIHQHSSHLYATFRACALACTRFCHLSSQQAYPLSYAFCSIAANVAINSAAVIRSNACNRFRCSRNRFSRVCTMNVFRPREPPSTRN